MQLTRIRARARILLLGLLTPESLVSAAALRRHGFQPIVIERSNRALSGVKRGEYDLAVVDADSSKRSDTALIHTVRALDPAVPLVVVSELPDCDAVLRLHGLCDMLLPKPIDSGALAAAARKLLAASSGVDCIACFCERWLLSPREGQVLRGALTGLRNKEIADRMKCRLATVLTYWARILKKTGCSSRAEAMALVVQCPERRCRRESACSEAGSACQRSEA